MVSSAPKLISRFKGWQQIVLLTTFVFFLFFLLNKILGDNLGSKINIFNDPLDRRVYAHRGSWYTTNKIPYVDIKSEYPQIATYFFAVPYVIDKVFPIESASYATIFSLLMLVFFILSIILSWQLIEEKWKVWLFFLPASFYFTINRFDIIPCFLSLWCLYLWREKSHKTLAIILAVGFFTKWYLALFMPIFLVAYYYLYEKINWSMIIIFALTSLIIILPTLLTGGVEALMSSYTFHLGRAGNSESFFYILSSIHGGFLYSWRTAFLVLQFLAVPLVLTSRIDSFDEVKEWALLAVLFFIFFAKFYSPQWILWLLPLLIINAKSKTDILWIVLLDLVTYIYFPIIFYTAGPTSEIFVFFILAKITVFIMIGWPLLKKLMRKNFVYGRIRFLRNPLPRRGN